jgi:hypothetical protein
MSETQSDNTNSNDMFLGSVYLRTALYVLLVAAGVFVALQAHQFANRKQDPAADETPPQQPETADEPSQEQDVFDVALPADEVGMHRVQALPPVAPPTSARLRFAWGRRALEPGRVQLVWVYSASSRAGDVMEHYRQAFQQAGYRQVEGKTPAKDRETLVFLRDEKLATLSVPTQDPDETLQRFDVTMSRPEQPGDFVARSVSPESP